MRKQLCILSTLGWLVVGCGGLGTPALSLDPDCKNENSLDRDGEVWTVVPTRGIPDEWQNRGSIEGEFERVDDDSATFTVGATVLQLTATGGVSLPECSPW